jgi:hypothetical protein
MTRRPSPLARLFTGDAARDGALLALLPALDGETWWIGVVADELPADTRFAFVAPASGAGHHWHLMAGPPREGGYATVRPVHRHGVLISLLVYGFDVRVARWSPIADRRGPVERNPFGVHQGELPGLARRGAL